LKKNNLKETLKEGKNVFGPFMKFTDPAAVEIMGFAGFDFVIIDAEHGPISSKYDKSSRNCKYYACYSSS